VRPVSYRQARDFAAAHHRHPAPPRRHRFSLGLTNRTGTLLGVAMVGRPATGYLDDGLTAEITCLATDGSGHACAVLLAAAWRVARRMGYRRMITSTGVEEIGAALRAAGWTAVADLPAVSGWDASGRVRGARGAAGARWQVGTSDRTGESGRPRRVGRRR
jgi:hypothetical protein